MCNINTLLSDLNITEDKFNKLLESSHKEFELNYRDLVFLEHYENIAIQFNEQDIIEFYEHSDAHPKLKIFNFEDWKIAVLDAIEDNTINTGYKRCPITNGLIRNYYEIFSDDLDITLTEDSIKVNLILNELESGE